MKEVRPGLAGSGFFAFRVTVVIRDFDPGTPDGRSVGKTCVGRIEREEYILKRDEFGEWNAIGRWNLAAKEIRCQQNPAPGVSSIPLSALMATAALVQWPELAVAFVPAR